MWGWSLSCVCPCLPCCLFSDVIKPGLEVLKSPNPGIRLPSLTTMLERVSAPLSCTFTNALGKAFILMPTVAEALRGVLQDGTLPEMEIASKLLFDNAMRRFVRDNNSCFHCSKSLWAINQPGLKVKEIMSEMGFADRKRGSSFVTPMLEAIPELAPYNANYVAKYTWDYLRKLLVETSVYFDNQLRMLSITESPPGGVVSAVMK